MIFNLRLSTKTGVAAVFIRAYLENLCDKPTGISVIEASNHAIGVVAEMGGSCSQVYAKKLRAELSQDKRILVFKQGKHWYVKFTQEGKDEWDYWSPSWPNWGRSLDRETSDNQQAILDLTDKISEKGIVRLIHTWPSAVRSFVFDAWRNERYHLLIVPVGTKLKRDSDGNLVIVRIKT